MKKLFELAKCFEGKLSQSSYREHQSSGEGESGGLTETPMGFSGGPQITQEREESSAGFSRASILIGEYLKKTLEKNFKDLPAVVHVAVEGSSVGYFVYDPYAGEYSKSGNYIDEIEITDKELKEILGGLK